MNFEPGTNVIRLLPPKGMRWDAPRFRLVPIKDGTRVEHDGERWRGCPMCVREAVQGVVDFIAWVNV